ncbi:hypothetical protein [Arhodomonas aquaeolei]|uniref:hypothetical protein n=1 Tax=Arhodomonas aquaeolei TaxID=2369 RepID=UPI00036BDA5F|nr:hypothetical protein [Arhodomonas aquaeolei]
MKKAVFIATMLVASTASASWLSNMFGGDEGKDLLAYVPADSDYYLGYSEPYDVAGYLSHWQGVLNRANAREELPSPAEATEAGGPGAGMIMALLEQTYLDADAETPGASIGLDDGGVSGFYEVAGLPVLRYRLDDVDTFKAALDAAQKRAGVTPAASTGENVRRYPFAGKGDATPPALLIAVRDGDAVFTLAVAGMEDALPKALGETLPGESMADSGRLEKLAETYGTLPWATGYIDHRALASAVTGTGDGGTAALVKSIARAYGEEPPELEAGCVADMNAVVDVWPRSVLGVSELDPDTGAARVRWVTDIADGDLRSTLKRLRGHIPSAAQGSLASAGLGLDISSVVPVMQTLANRFKSTQWQCPQMQQLQQQVNTQQLSQMGMLTAMLGDVRGATLTLLDGPAEKGRIPTGTLDIATSRPGALWQVIQGFIGTNVQPEVGGEPVSIDHPMVSGKDVRVALRDGRFTVLAGQDAAVPDSGADLAANGILDLRYNPSALSGALMSDLEAVPGDQAEIDEVRDQLKAMDIDQEIMLDITDQGLLLDVAATPGSGDS